MAGLARSRSPPPVGVGADDPREGQPARRLDAPLERRHVAPPLDRGLSRRVSGGDAELQAARSSSGWTNASTGSSPLRRTGHRERKRPNPRTVGRRFTADATSGCAASYARGMSGSASRSTSSARTRRALQRRVRRRPAPGGWRFRCELAHGARETDSPSHAVVARQPRQGWTSSTDARCLRPPSGWARAISFAWRRCMVATLSCSTRRARWSRARPAPGTRTTSSRRSRGGRRAARGISSPTRRSSSPLGDDRRRRGSKPAASRMERSWRPTTLPSPCRSGTSSLCTSLLRLRTRSAASPSIVKRGCSTRRGRRSTASTQQAPTSAVWPRAAMRAVSRLRSSGLRRRGVDRRLGGA